jgi:hypothetical protein
MSVTSLAGGIGLGLQTAKGTVQGTIVYVPATQVDLNFEQNANPYPFEVGGDYWQKDSYKSSVMGAGGFDALARPDTIGYMLKAFFGSCQTTAGPEAGTYEHLFTGRRAANGTWGGDGMIPWVTLVKNLAGKMAEQHSDARCASCRLNYPTANLVNYNAAFIAAFPEEVAVPPVMTFDADPAFNTCTGLVTVGEAGGATYDRTDPTNGNNAKATAITIDLQNQLSTDEFSIGSYYLDDVTLMSKSAAVTYDLIMRDAGLWREVYRNGAAGVGQWDPALFSGQLTVRSETAKPIAGTTKGSMEVYIPKLDYLALPTGLSGNELVRISLRSQLTQGEALAPIEIRLVNSVATYPD